MKKKFILALDQGTTSSRAVLFDHNGKIKGVSQQEFTQYFPQPGYVEHNPVEIFKTQYEVASEVINKAGIKIGEVETIGITNQRETTIVWNKKTGKPVYNAIVWQDRRTAEMCDKLKKQGIKDLIKKKTGLEIDAYFSGTKIKWILDNVPGARDMAENGELAFGTVDTWLIWNLTGGKHHFTDVSNASRTLLFNINTLNWDKELLKILDIPENILPEVKSNSDFFGDTKESLFGESISITGVAGDQQAALFGQMCVHKGMVKNNYGTGCFIVLNTGNKPVISQNRLLTTIAWKLNNEVSYALEGSVFVGGAVIQWLRDELQIIHTAGESEKLASTVENNGGVYFVPAFTGLGAPYWNQYAKGAVYGLTRGTSKAHIARAALESIAFQSKDVIDAMQQDIKYKIKTLRVDGGASANNLLMQFQSDLLQTKVQRPEILESTSLGAAYFAGLYTGFWKGTEELENQWKIDKVFLPEKNKDEVMQLEKNWEKVISMINQ